MQQAFLKRMSGTNVAVTRGIVGAVSLALGASLYGCGGADFGGMQRNLGGDIGNGYNSSIGSRGRGPGDTNTGIGNGRGVYPVLETSFQVPEATGDPFDYEKTNVQVTVRRPDNSTAEVPAFYDGDKIWRIRYTPTLTGQYSIVNVRLNNAVTHEEKMEKRDWSVKGDPLPGFVRIDRGDKTRFMFDNGARYYPLGHNQAWHSSDLPDTTELFGKMHDAGENWSRVWMTHWDGKNLDWSTDKTKQVKIGSIDLTAAKRWDTLVQSAEKNGIYFQMVVQHHGQYASRDGYKYSGNVDPNWQDNPYNVKNGGFLDAPENFFTNPQARALTKRKLYYIMSRWGYSPSILSYELFNEVENSDAGKGKLSDTIALWHREMTLFLRQFDSNRHLVTTSTSTPSVGALSETVDYVQQHMYPSDVLTALSGEAITAANGKKLDKPAFVGEFGSASGNDTDGIALHEGIWASLMRNGSGAAQYWYWDGVEKNNLYSHYQAASGFLAASGLPNHGGLIDATLPVETAQRAALSFGPGGGFAAATQSEFVVGTDGIPAGMSRFPAFLQGQAHRDMMPKPLTLQVTYPQSGTFTVSVGQVSKGGAHLKISVDGKSVERDYPAGAADSRPKADSETVQVDVAEGAHTITIQNTGADWAVIKHFTLSDYAPALASLARVGRDYAVAWVYNRGGVDAPVSRASALSPVSGTLRLIGLQPGRYRATWWDTRTGKSLDSSELTVDKNGSGKIAAIKTGAAKSSGGMVEGVALSTPPITQDVALYVTKAGAANDKSAAKRGGGRGNPQSSEPISTNPTSGSSDSSVPASTSPASAGSSLSKKGF